MSYCNLPVAQGIGDLRLCYMRMPVNQRIFNGLLTGASNIGETQPLRKSRELCPKDAGLEATELGLESCDDALLIGQLVFN